MSESEKSPEVERRRVPRLRSLLSGIIVDNHGCTLDCTVRNISAYGAKLVLADAFRLPDSFNLKVPHHDQIHHAKVIWRKGDAAGLELSDVEDVVHPARHQMTPREMKRAHQKELDAAQF